MTGSASSQVVLDGRHLTLESIEAIADGARASIGAEARDRVVKARDFVESRFASGEAIYGVTTGFGRLANVHIDPKDAGQLQLNLVRSHASGTGAPLDRRSVRAAGALRANSLSAGHSGVKLETLDLIVELLNRGVTPVVPCQGSVGASGDLAPLAHMSLTLIGEGEAYFGDERMAERRRTRTRGSEAGDAGREGRPRAHQRHASDDRNRGARRIASRALGGSGRRNRRDVARSVPRHRARFRSPP